MGKTVSSKKDISSEYQAPTPPVDHTDLDGLTVNSRDGVAGNSATSGEGRPHAGYGGEAKCDASSLDHLVPEKGIDGRTVVAEAEPPGASEEIDLLPAAHGSGGFRVPDIS